MIITCPYTNNSWNPLWSVPLRCYIITIFYSATSEICIANGNWPGKCLFNQRKIKTLENIYILFSVVFVLVVLSCVVLLFAHSFIWIDEIYKIGMARIITWRNVNNGVYQNTYEAPLQPLNRHIYKDNTA